MAPFIGAILGTLNGYLIGQSLGPGLIPGDQLMTFAVEGLGVLGSSFVGWFIGSMVAKDKVSGVVANDYHETKDWVKDQVQKYIKRQIDEW